MRKMVNALLGMALVAMILPAASMAMDPPVDNGFSMLCVYTTWDETEGPGDNFYADYGLFTPYPIKIVLYYPEGVSQTLGGFEFQILFDNAGTNLEQGTNVSFAVETWVPGQGGITNFGSGSFMYLAGVNTPVPHFGNPVVIFDGSILFLNVPNPGDPVLMRFGPASPPTIPGQMTYNDNGNPDVFFAMYPNSVGGDLSLPVFGWGTSVSVEAKSWTDVKGLFQ